MRQIEQNVKKRRNLSSSNLSFWGCEWCTFVFFIKRGHVFAITQKSFLLFRIVVNVHHNHFARRLQFVLHQRHCHRYPQCY